MAGKPVLNGEVVIQTTAYIRAILAVLITGVIIAPAFAADAAPALSFSHPAAKWTEAIPLGNGRIGAMDFGGVEDERFQINETTLWGGVPHDYVAPDAAGHLDE